MENIPDWNYYVKTVIRLKKSDQSPEDYKQVRKYDEQIFRVTKAEYCKKLDIETLPGSRLQFKRSFSFTEVDNTMCVLEDHLEVDTGYPAVFQQLFKHQIQSAVAANLKKLQILLERSCNFTERERNSTSIIN